MNPQSRRVDRRATPRPPARRLSPAVGTVRITYPDLHGIQRGKDVPVGELEPRRDRAGSPSAGR